VQGDLRTRPSGFTRASPPHFRTRRRQPPRLTEDRHADYRFRAQGPRAAVVAAVGRLAEGIDYQNFKSAVAKRQGPERAHVYGAVWEDLLAIQQGPRR